MTVADVLDRLPESERPLMIAAMQAFAQAAVEKALEQAAPDIARQGIVIGASIVGQTLGARVIVNYDDEAQP